jgi:hypothetical protein
VAHPVGITPMLQRGIVELPRDIQREAQRAFLTRCRVKSRLFDLCLPDYMFPKAEAAKTAP